MDLRLSVSREAESTVVHVDGRQRDRMTRDQDTQRVEKGHRIDASGERYRNALARCCTKGRKAASEVAAPTMAIQGRMGALKELAGAGCLGQFSSGALP